MAPPIRRNEPRPVPPPPVTARPTPPPPPPPPAPAKQEDRFEAAHNVVGQFANGAKIASDSVAGTQVREGTGPRRFGNTALPGGNGSIVEGTNTRLSRGAGAVGLAASVSQLPGAGYLAARDVRDAFRNPSGESINKAAGSVASLASTGLNVVKGGLEVAGNVSNFRAATNAARTAFQAAAPEALRTGAGANRVVGAATDAALAGGSRNVVRGAAAAVAEEGAERAARLAGNAARGALRNGGTAVARAAGRFAPGLNVAIAVADTAAAVSTIRDPNASTGKKITSGITALGSIAAATNIPVVSQAGAVVSTVSSFVGSFF
ncbi:hypothetical protein [Corallococcus macrosporus]|uniref:Uncharacterized protein n=2 Tax=Myxococcaceae TaxID=31 RepID=A0A250JP37_9BACT|nr:hypothetical protein [Corallococcus macrosporus]AEI62470.1 hypothetical protein LILAB_02725 [Corallococcus macrosporus]ATB45625.1 hypothetical protein MYMAC_001210 [Corallococcus macrosporus DSM 14697]